MSNYEPTKEEIRIRVVSEHSNPYAKECPNRHLWSEGYRRGAKDETAALRKENERLSGVLRRAAKYVDHSIDCACYGYRQPTCNCGVSDFYKELELLNPTNTQEG